MAIKRCPEAIATGILHDPYTNATVPFVRGNQIGASVQIDHIVPLALAWDMGARYWTDEMRLRFANDPANLIAVAGKANQDKSDHEPAVWMPPNEAFWCQYSMQFIEVVRGYSLPVDAARRSGYGKRRRRVRRADDDAARDEPLRSSPIGTG